MTRLRIRRSTTTLPNGTRVTTQKVVAAPILEWRLQASQIRRLRAMPEYGSKFLFVGGMEAARRSPQEAVKAKATGLTAGHPDLTIFLAGGQCRFIENKGERGALSAVQKERHADLAALGHVVKVVKAATEEEAADAAEAQVRAWVMGAEVANDNAVWREAATG